VLDVGPNQTLSTTFSPADGTDYISVNASTTINVNSVALTVTVVSPNGGEKVFAAVPIAIQWSASGDGGLSSFDVAVSRNNGTSYTAIPGCTGLAGSLRSCSWTPTGPATSTARVRVMAHGASGATVSDASDAVFTVSTVVPSITLTSPNTAVNWAIGTRQTISWKQNLGTEASVKIELSRDGGTSWEPLAASVQNTAANSGTFQWLVSGPATSNALLRVTWLEGTAGDTSDAPFSIGVPAISITAPDTAVTWRAGSTHTIRFIHNLGPGLQIGIDISRDGGASWSPITTVATTSGSAGSVPWLVSGPPTSQARVRARSLADPSVQATSEVNFTITSRVTVTAPNTAVTWAAGSTRQITWNHNLGTAELVSIDFSPNGGASWISLATGVANTTATTGSWAGVMPSTVTAQALIRVSPVGDSLDGDVSNAPFTLAAPAVTVTAPNSNVNWTVGSTHRITWSHNLGTAETVNIDVSRDGGGTWTSLISGATNSTNTGGSYSWTIDEPGTTMGRIRVAWTSDNAVQDQGDVNFRIH
jgi:hypothetical protein